MCACGLWEGRECRVGVGGGRLGVERGWSRRVGVTLSKYVCQNSMPAELQFNRDLFLPFFFFSSVLIEAVCNLFMLNQNV